MEGIVPVVDDNKVIASSGQFTECDLHLAQSGQD